MFNIGVQKLSKSLLISIYLINSSKEYYSFNLEFNFNDTFIIKNSFGNKSYFLDKIKKTK